MTPETVQNAATLLSETSTRPKQLLPPGTSILEVYDNAAQELLILGEPGAGKSFLLIELAQQLVVRAGTDKTHPLPVILPLSSWAVKRPSLQIWLAEQVAEIYTIPKSLAKNWIEENKLLPLLDGLDEMDEAARPACIKMINDFHREHPLLPLVICSREAEYKQASRSKRLLLQNTVIVQPLTRSYVQAYLAQGGQLLSSLSRALSTNRVLAKIATTPLMLHILILTYQGISVQQLPNRRKQLQHQIWTDYVQRMIERKRDAIHHLSPQIFLSLCSLARQMRDQSQTIFYLERIQPDWLPQRKRRCYRWSAGMLCGFPCSLLGIPIFGLLIGLFSGIRFARKSKIEPAEILTWSRANWRARSLYGSMGGLFCGSLFGAFASFFFGPFFGLLCGLLFGLLFTLCVTITSGFSRKMLPSHLTLSPNEGISRSIKNGCFYGLLGGSLCGLLGGIVVGLASGIASGLFFALLSGLPIGMIFGLFGGLGAAIQHYVLRFWLWQSHLFPWKAQRFLDEMVICILLQRTGGGYTFVHRLLLEYFADLQSLSTSTPLNAPRSRGRAG